MDWARMLAYVTGTVDQELPARNEYLTAENRILKAQLNGRLKLSDAERSTLGEIAYRLGRTALAEVATVAKPAYGENIDPRLLELKRVECCPAVRGFTGRPRKQCSVTPGRLPAA